jgi:hypothetical protein
MIIRSTTVHECWCPKCGTGQMDQIHDILFKERVQLTEMIGRQFTCGKCGQENELDDVLIVIPTHFMVASQKDTAKVKSNEELQNWLNKEG